MRQEHNQAHRTPPVPHTSSLCAPSYRVPKPRFRAQETVRGLRGKKEFGLLLARAEPFGTLKNGSGSFWVLPACLRPGRVCCVLLSVLRASSQPFCGTASLSASSFYRKAYHFCVVEVAFGSHPSRFCLFSRFIGTLSVQCPVRETSKKLPPGNDTLSSGWLLR